MNFIRRSIIHGRQILSIIAASLVCIVNSTSAVITVSNTEVWAESGLATLAVLSGRRFGYAAFRGPRPVNKYGLP